MEFYTKPDEQETLSLLYVWGPIQLKRVIVVTLLNLEDITAKIRLTIENKVTIW